nr:MAG: ORF1 [Torque teno midi virus]
MPFWWQRRKRWWRGRRRPFYKRNKYTNKRRKRRPYRRGHRRTYKRRRRRRKKVRRKKQTLPIRQWQPESIRKCKIKGFQTHVLGGEGRQFVCYTDSKYDWNLPTTPGGGGFGVEKYTLQEFYREYKRGNNIWTSSNLLLDLCRYTGHTFKFFRHEHLDFVGTYIRNYPMQLEKYTYANTHPKVLLLSKHHFLVPSLKTKPLLRKSYIKVHIKPPRQMVNKWFFQDSFSETGLFVLKTAVCDLRYKNLGSQSSNQLVSLYFINNQFYQKKNWGHHSSETEPYKPYDKSVTSTSFAGKNYQGKSVTGTIKAETYSESISYKWGWFQKDLMQCVTLSQPQTVAPIIAARYNPTIDTGKGNKVWVSSLFTTTYAPPTTDTELILEDLPLWQLFFGYLSYVVNLKKDKYFLKSYILVFQSPFLEPKVGVGQYFVPIDQTFLQGQNPYGRYSLHTEKDKWFPNVSNQLESINAIVQCGPLIPKLDNQRQSTWELTSHYTSYFKWGGAQPPDYEAADPSQQVQFDVPDKIRKAIQISNPSQSAKGILHTWDFRRGFATETALKRMYENTRTDSDNQISSDTDEQPQKKIPKTNTLTYKDKAQEEEESCLLSLFEENIYQETQDQDLRQLINQQQQHQHNIKLKLLKLISNLKHKQQVMQLQTGLLN